MSKEEKPRQVSFSGEIDVYLGLKSLFEFQDFEENFADSKDASEKGLSFPPNDIELSITQTPSRLAQSPIPVFSFRSSLFEFIFFFLG